MRTLRKIYHVMTLFGGGVFYDFRQTKNHVSCFFNWNLQSAKLIALSKSADGIPTPEADLTDVNKEVTQR